MQAKNLQHFFMKILQENQKHQLNLTKLITIIALFALTLTFNTKVIAQEKNQMVRFAKIKVDPLQLEKYNAALKEQMTTAVRVEPGVLTYYAVADKNDPANISIL